nr:MAG: putative maturation protein [Leviviridae sp.]
MPTRDRTQLSVAALSGSSIWKGPGTLNGGWSAVNRTSRCVDIVDGTRAPHPLVITHSCPLAYTLTGKSRPVNQNHWEYNGRAQTLVAVVTGPSTSPPTENSALSLGLARSSPNRPKVDLAVGLAELKDLPRMLKNLWDNAIHHVNITRSSRNLSVGGMRNTAKRLGRESGSAYLEWEFGWRPLVDDLTKLLDFQSHVEKKLKMLRRMRERGSYGGKATVWEDVSRTSTANSYVSSLYQENNRMNYAFETTREWWVTTKWTPSVSLPPKGSEAEQTLARRLAFGQDFSPALIWELMPWSWLIDWFSNVGDLMALSRNTIPVSFSDSCLMKHTVTRFQFLGLTAGTGSPGVIPARFPMRETKERLPYGFMPPLPEFNLPFLSGKQLDILSSLALTRIK